MFSLFFAAITIATTLPLFHTPHFAFISISVFITLRHISRFLRCFHADICSCHAIISLIFAITPPLPRRHAFAATPCLRHADAAIFDTPLFAMPCCCCYYAAIAAGFMHAAAIDAVVIISDAPPLRHYAIYAAAMRCHVALRHYAPLRDERHER